MFSEQALNSNEKLFEEGIAYFNSGYFFEAHDTFEEIWMDVRGRDRRFYQGLVQLATGFYHVGMKNLNGGASQLNKGIDKLQEFQPAYRKLDITGLLNSVKKCLAEIEEQEPNRFSFLEFQKKIPKLERR